MKKYILFTSIFAVFVGLLFIISNILTNVSKVEAAPDTGTVHTCSSIGAGFGNCCVTGGDGLIGSHQEIWQCSHSGVTCGAVGGNCSAAYATPYDPSIPEYFNDAQRKTFLEAGLTINQFSAMDRLINSFKSTTQEGTPKDYEIQNYQWASCENGVPLCLINYGDGTYSSIANSQCDLHATNYKPNCSLQWYCSVFAPIPPISIGSAGSTRAEFSQVNPGVGNITLRLNSAGTEVVALQKFLLAAGYDIGIADGRLGLKTEAALKLWQVSVGLEDDGVFGDKSRTAAGGFVPSPKASYACAGKWECQRDGNFGTGLIRTCVKTDPACPYARTYCADGGYNCYDHWYIDNNDSSVKKIE